MWCVFNLSVPYNHSFDPTGAERLMKANNYSGSSKPTRPPAPPSLMLCERFVKLGAILNSCQNIKNNFAAA